MRDIGRLGGWTIVAAMAFGGAACSVTSRSGTKEGTGAPTLVASRQHTSTPPEGSAPDTGAATGSPAIRPGDGCPLTTAQVSAAVGHDMTAQAHSNQQLCGFQSNAPQTSANPLGVPLVYVYTGPTDLERARSLLTDGGGTVELRPQWGAGAFQRPPKAPAGLGAWSVEGFVPNFHFLVWTTQVDHSSSDTSQVLDKIVQAGAVTVDIKARQSVRSQGPSVKSALAPKGYQRHNNARFGFACDVPEHFRSQAAPGNGDGFGYTSPQGQAEMRCFGENNLGFLGNAKIGSTSVKSAYEKALSSHRSHGDSITYQALIGNSMTVSGFVGDTGAIYFDRILWGSRSINTLSWSYPRSLQDQLKAAVEHSARTFRSGDLASSH